MKNFRRYYLLFLCGALLLSPLATPFSQAADGEYFVYIGAYTREESKGIYAYRFQPATRKLTSIGLVAETESPSFLTIHPNRKFLYAVNEGDATVSAFAIDSKTGQLTALNKVEAGGGSSCHLVVEKTGKHLLVANYGSGKSVASFPINPDGSLGEATALIEHSGSSIGRRQRGPHAHATVLSPDHQILFVPDLGLDQVLAYRVDAASGKLSPADPPFTKITPGSGPRHMAFHPNGKFAYVNSEMGSLVTAFAYDSSKRSLNEIQTISTLPADFKETNNTAEIEVHPNGRFLYVSNRGHDSIAVFKVDTGSGKLSFVEHVSTQGSTPRNFAIDPSGKYMFAANQSTDNIVLFSVDGNTGRLTPTGDVLKVDAPVCVIFHPAQ